MYWCASPHAERVSVVAMVLLRALARRSRTQIRRSYTARDDALSSPIDLTAIHTQRVGRSRARPHNASAPCFRRPAFVEYGPTRLSAPMSVWMRQCLTKPDHAARVTEGACAVLSIAEVAAIDVLPAADALAAAIGRVVVTARHVWISAAFTTASSRRSSPTSLPSEDVIGELAMSCSVMYFAISSIRT